MNSKDVKGIPVISIADGTKLGSVTHAYVDPAAKRVVAFAAHTGGGLLSAGADRGLVIDANSVHSLGPAALSVDSAAATAGHALDANLDLILLDDLTKLKVFTEGGAAVGQVASVDFDERTFALTRLEISSGVFKTNTTVSMDQVLTLGQEVVVVTNAVAETAAPTATRPHQVAETAPESGATP